MNLKQRYILADDVNKLYECLQRYYIVAEMIEVIYQLQRSCLNVC